ncbi:hypothetical protein AOC21_02770 [Polynucleobacter sp. VK25]|uniref:hypothetical protein n=1 Tax=Polynucleobacter sp. VK25 TaxID=1758398 RepID=UPI001BFE3951|nr:hypothetical protein [Polynucleobacter sp. VK25]QWD68836.1 hypothetical protein AOC21_02770 [Polynucleobacter sp. VK25]
MNLSRRTFIASAALAPVACGVPLSYQRGTPVAQPKPIPTVRAPQVGQEWTYVKRDVFDGKIRGLITERVSSVGQTIVIDRWDENGGGLPSEIQGPWGMVQTSTSWPRLLSFNPPLPLWPLELTSKWSKQFDVKYSLGGYSENSYGWQEYMSAHGWEQITVPAGTFLTLRYDNLINYESNDDNKTDCIRKESIWFAPSIGRWVARESSGSYIIVGQGGMPILEDKFQWQLTAYK